MFEDPGLEAVLRGRADALRRAPSYFRRVRREQARNGRQPPSASWKSLALSRSESSKSLRFAMFASSLCVPRSASNAIDQAVVLSSLCPEGRGSTSDAIAQTPSLAYTEHHAVDATL